MEYRKADLFAFEVFFSSGFCHLSSECYVYVVVLCYCWYLGTHAHNIVIRVVPTAININNLAF